jgi:polyferredoxin
VLLLAVVARGAFCGWICPLGAIQEWLYAGGLWLQQHIPPLGRSVRALKSWAGVQSVRRFDQRVAPTLIERIDHWLSYGKFVVLAWAVLGAASYGYMVFRDYDPWSALLTIGELELTGGGVVLAVPLRLPAGRGDRVGRQAQPAADPARWSGLRWLRAVQQSMSGRYPS